MSEAPSTFFRFLTYFFLAGLALTLLSYGLRRRLHQRYSSFPVEWQHRLTTNWRRFLFFSRLSLFLVPPAITIFVARLEYETNLPPSLTAPPLALLYLNLVVLHVDRKWHLRALTRNSSRTPDEPAA